MCERDEVKRLKHIFFKNPDLGKFFRNLGLISCHVQATSFALPYMGGGQNFERRNVERPIFRNSKIANIKIMKDELLFDNFIFEFNFPFFINYFPESFDNFSSCELLNFEIVELFFFYFLNFKILQNC